MALGFMQLAKLMKGGLTPDDLAEMLSSMGLELNAAELESDQVPMTFQQLWDEGHEADAAIVRIELRRSNGDKFTGLIVFNKGASLPFSAISAPTALKLAPGDA